MINNDAIANALSEFLRREEIIFENKESSLFITDQPVPQLQNWRGSVLSAHRSVIHKRLLTSLPSGFSSTETVIVASPISEIAKWQMQTALAVTQGQIIAVGENRRGGERLAGLVGAEGHPDLQTLARAHCRAVVAKHTRSSTAEIPQLIARPVNGYKNIQALPGVFSGERADRGSELLITCAMQRIVRPPPIKSVLDLGCGCGAVGIALLEGKPDISVDFVDVDFRATESTKMNLTARNLNCQSVFWTDATSPTQELPRKKYDLVVLNPPFHAHGMEQRDLGRKLIDIAFKHTDYELLIVGNTHLGYGAFLKAHTSAVSEVGLDRGFTVWSAKGKR